MASATSMHTSTSRAMPQPGTPGPDRAEGENDTPPTKRKSSDQGSFPKEVALPLQHLAVGGVAGIQTLQREEPGSVMLTQSKQEKPHH